MPLHLTLNEEFKRVAKLESKPMEELVDEIAALSGYSARQLYNFRAGKWDLPSSLIPVLCKRFSSRLLLDALTDDCSEIEVEVPELYDLDKMITGMIRRDMEVYDRFLEAFEDGTITAGELSDLEALSNRLICDVRQRLAIAQADHKRRQTVAERILQERRTA